MKRFTHFLSLIIDTKNGIGLTVIARRTSQSQVVEFPPSDSGNRIAGPGLRAIAAPGLVRHFGHHRANRPAQMFQLIEAVALCFDEIGVGMRADVSFAAKPPDGMCELTYPTFFDGFASETEGFRIAVIEVDRKEEARFSASVSNCPPPEGRKLKAYRRARDGQT